MPQYHQQVTGGACSMTLYMETSPGCVPPGAKGVSLAFHSETFSKGSSKQQRTVITGKRGPGKPFQGMPQMSGSIESASYSPQLGWLMRALCGPAVSTLEPSRSLKAAPVVELTDCRVRAVGLPCPDHGLVQDSVITVHGTVNYDGQYRIAYGTTKDIIAIQAPFVAETLTSSAKVYRGRAPSLSGDAVDLGSGLVGLPIKGGVHALHAGESVRVSGTASYDGDYLLQPGGRDGLLAITAAYVAETFDGSELAVPLFYRHVFTLPKRQPTVCMEKYLDFEAAANAERYQRFGFCKVNGFNCSFGGDSELIFSVEFAVGAMDEGAEPLDPAPAQLPGIPMDNIECALWVAGVRRGDVETGSMSNAFGIQPHAAVGDLGNYSRMPEGDPECRLTMNVFLEEIDYQELAKARSTIPVALSISSSGGDEAWFRFPETELDVPGTPITGKEGLMQEVTAMAFVHRSDSVLTFELINRVQQYA